jgi:hypothetical protein
LGLAALVLFLGLLQPLTAETADAPLPPQAILSSGAALLGVIATEYFVRRLQKPGRTFEDTTYWMLGPVTLLPAMVIALVRF